MALVVFFAVLYILQLKNIITRKLLFIIEIKIQYTNMPFNKKKTVFCTEDLCQFIKYRVQFFEENWNLKLKALNPVSLLKIYKKIYT